jgi:hypothetical protein
VVSRFTIDSATEFLFGNDIRTLSAGLPYPASSPLANSDEFMNHPSNKFASAFLAGQFHSNLRTQYGSSWPLAEFWKDVVKPHRKIVDKFVEPILLEALAKRAKVGGETPTDSKGEGEDEEILLNHLINHTQGFCFVLSLVIKYISYPFISDIQVLKDEVTFLIISWLCQANPGPNFSWLTYWSPEETRYAEMRITCGS